MISQSVVISLYVALTIFISFPVLLLVIYKIRTKASIIPYFVGAVIYFTIGFLGESFIHSLLLGDHLPIGGVIQDNCALYVIYYSVVTAFVEVFGMYFTYKAIMKQYHKRESGVVFGIGFAGMEGFLIAGPDLFTNIYFVSLLNEAGIDGFKQEFLNVNAETDMSMIDEWIESARSITVSDIVLLVVDRMLFFILSLSIAVIVYYAVNKKVKSMLWTAVIARALCSVPSIIVKYLGLADRTGDSTGAIIGMGTLGLLVVVVFCIALKIHKEYDSSVLITDIRQVFSGKTNVV